MTDPWIACQILDLTPYFNNDGISFDDNRGDGDFAGLGVTYPAEDLPPSNALVVCLGVPFRFPDKRDGRNNNISMEGQRISVSQARFANLFLLGAAEENSLEDVIRFVYVSGRQHETPLGLSSWRLRHDLKYGERVAIECRGYHFLTHDVHTDLLGVDYGIWLQTVAIDPTECLAAIELPDNPGMHVFAMTLQWPGCHKGDQ